MIRNCRTELSTWSITITLSNPAVARILVYSNYRNDKPFGAKQLVSQVHKDIGQNCPAGGHPS